MLLGQTRAEEMEMPPSQVLSAANHQCQHSFLLFVKSKVKGLQAYIQRVLCTLGRDVRVKQPSHHWMDHSILMVVQSASVAIEVREMAVRFGIAETRQSQ